MRPSILPTLSVLSLILPSLSLAAAGRPIDPALFKDLKARSIGPAVMGGRVSDLALDPKDGATFYVGLGTAGVMKTSDDGASFSAIFENEAVAAVGAVAVAPSNPKYVWVGTGEANDRNSSSWGDGVYLSTDSGKTWKNVGLKTSRTIARIAVHPTDSTMAYVAAMGDLWTPGGERGLYKTSDAGNTWKKVLGVDGADGQIVGCGDVLLDPSNANTVYAALYARRRTPWSFRYGTDLTGGRDAGGLFKSTDGGATWKKLEAGLPKKTGRIGLSIYRKDTSILYAVVQSDEGGLASIDEVTSKSGGVFRSKDGGDTWERTSDLNPRSFYFSQIRVDPGDSSKVYLLGYMLHVSLDGGRTFREDYSKNIHPDLHALAIDPANPKRVIIGTDGGVYRSYSGGKSWNFLNTFAAGQFYRVTADSSEPYRIAGGLQDNLNWVGPSRTYTKEGIVNTDWINIEGGDGFYCVFDPDDRNIVYAESQTGYLHRFNLANGESKTLRPSAAEGQEEYRFHWNSPLIGSRHARGTLYLAGNRVFKLWDKGEKWAAISGDLSVRHVDRILATGSGAENYGVVYALAESPVKAGLLWAGTDDGKLWITGNDGGEWTDLTSSLPGAVKGEWISRIEPSHYDPDAAYLVVDAHRSGKFMPLVYRTANRGRSWTSVAGDLPVNGPAKVLREDPFNRELLFAGTEFGLYASRDGGLHWGKIGGLPTVAVDDIQIHPRDRDLIVATHGRSLYVLDDIRPIEDLADSVLTKEVHVFPPRKAWGTNLLTGWADWSGNTVFRGANPPAGAHVTYYIGKFTGEPVSVAVTDSAGRVVANLSGPNGPGFHRVSWDLKFTSDLLNPYGGEGAFFVKPGEYTVEVTHGKASDKRKLRVEIAKGLKTR